MLRSKKKAKWCCHGPVRTIDVRTQPLDMTEEAFTLLRRTEVAEMRRQFDRLAELPEVETVETADRRIDLARVVLSLRDQGRVSPILAAIAVVELDREESILFTSAIAESISVLAGDQRTPSGLLVAAR